MDNVLLLKNHTLESGYEKRDERVESFAKTLNDAFKQFQRLCDDYKELLEKCKESKGNSSDVLNEIQNVSKKANAKSCKCTAAAKGNVIPKKESVAVAKEIKADCDVATVTTNRYEESSKPENSQIFQIFSQDFCTQGLEESFVHSNKTPLQEIQNVTPNRAQSPILGSRKGKPRVASSPVSSSNLSQKSVCILNDFTNEKKAKIANQSISSPLLQSDGITTSKNFRLNPIESLLPAPEATLISTPKIVRKWDISTVHNVNTDVIVGTNKILRQSKLFVTTEKVTDLSSCDDVCINKLENRDQGTKVYDVINTSYGTQINNNCLEDSVIQGSPEHEKSLSKKRERIARRNKSVEILQQKCRTDGNAVKYTNRVETHEVTNHDVHQTDADITIFDPKVALTQYTHLSSYSKISQIEKAPVEGNPGPGKRIDLEDIGGNDSNVIDDTLFVENVIPPDSLSQSKLDFEKRVKKKKLSLKKFFNVNRNREGISSDNKISGAEIETFVDASSSEETKGASPPRKKLALTNFHAPMKKNTSPNYAYKGNPVRKKAERALLNGWSCLECQKYYEAIGLSEEELQKRKNKCSRHRSKFNEKKVSQKDYWDPEFSSSFHSTMWNDD